MMIQGFKIKVFNVFVLVVGIYLLTKSSYVFGIFWTGLGLYMMKKAGNKELIKHARKSKKNNSQVEE